MARKNNTWQDTLSTAITTAEKGKEYAAKARSLVWEGAKGAISEWDGGADDTGERLYDDIKAVMGESRKGTASKIKTVALASLAGLDLNEYPSLSKAFTAARAMLNEPPAHAAEDAAAEEVVSSLSAPKTATTPEGAAKILVSQGPDEFARLVVATLDDNVPAQRAFLRALSEEISAVAKSKADAEKAAKAAQVEAERAAKAAEREAAKAAREAERAAKKAAAPKAAAPKAAAPKAKAKAKPVADRHEPEPEPKGDDLFADLEDEAPAPAPAKAKAKAKPVRRAKPVKRG